MFDVPWLRRLGVTRGKLVLIGVLAVVLVTVVVLQWPEASTPSPTIELNNAAAGDDVTTPTASSEPQNRPSETPARAAVVWPQLTLAEIVRHNPFQLPEEMRPEPAKVDNQQDSQDQRILQSLTEPSSAMILMVGEEHVARVGATTLRPGDKIGHYRVAKIDATGVWLVDESEEHEN